MARLAAGRVGEYVRKMREVADAERPPPCLAGMGGSATRTSAAIAEWVTPRLPSTAAMTVEGGLDRRGQASVAADLTAWVSAVDLVRAAATNEGKYSCLDASKDRFRSFVYP